MRLVGADSGTTVPEAVTIVLATGLPLGRLGRLEPALVGTAPSPPLLGSTKSPAGAAYTGEMRLRAPMPWVAVPWLPCPEREALLSAWDFNCPRRYGEMNAALLAPPPTDLAEPLWSPMWYPAALSCAACEGRMERDVALSRCDATARWAARRSRARRARKRSTEVTPDRTASFDDAMGRESLLCPAWVVGGARGSPDTASQPCSWAHGPDAPRAATVACMSAPSASCGPPLRCRIWGGAPRDCGRLESREPLRDTPLFWLRLAFRSTRGSTA